MKDFIDDERKNSIDDDNTIKDESVDEIHHDVNNDETEDKQEPVNNAEDLPENTDSNISSMVKPEENAYSYSSGNINESNNEDENLVNNQREDNESSSAAPPYYNNLKGSQNMLKNEPATYNSTPYNIPQMNGNGQILYTPATPNKPKNKRKKGKAVGIAVLCIVGLLLSCGAGFFGAYLVNDGNFGGIYSDEPSSGGPAIYKSIQTTPTSSDGSEYSYADIVAAISNTVVEISTEYQTFGWYQYVTEGAGSGVIISDDGYIITNNHVICGNDNSTIADSITVRMKNGEEYDAEVVGTDSDADIALLKIDAKDLECAVFGDSDNLAVGEEVIAIGNPLGELGGTVTNGIISALAREVDVDGVTMNLLQTNAAINPGNSGGGLFNMKGELIGIVNAKSSGTGIEGLGFAIPSNDALETSDQLIEYGYVKGKPMIGVTLTDVTDVSKARYLGVNAYGVYITETVEGYNDDVLKALDRIVAVNDTEITSGDDVIKIVKSSSVGDVLKFMLYRDGKMMTVDVKCYESGTDISSED